MARTFALAVLLVLLLGAYISDASSSRSRSGCRRLRKLYNQRVVKAEVVRRPLGSGKKMWGLLSHSGTLVTLDDGSEWLVHKGKGYGCRYGDTVATSSRHMSRRWRKKPGSHRAVHGSTLGDFVKAGGTEYSVIGDNCHDASCRMSELP